ncbi:hypothetical protein Tco_1531386 [Tanacetum coccineum]
MLQKEIHLDVVGTSGCHSVVLQSFLVERIEKGNELTKRHAFWSLNEDILKITVLTSNMPYPSRKIWRIYACTHQRPRRKQDPIRRIQKKAIRRIQAGLQALRLMERTPMSCVGYWKLGSDEIKPTNDETSDLKETNHDDEQEIGEIFRVETNLFDYETSLCEKFKEFNYLLKIDPDVLTKDIEGFKTYDKYNDDWIYKWNKNVPWWPTISWREDGYCNGGNLPRVYIVGNTLIYQDLEWYEALKDSELKEEALRNKAIMEGLIDEDDESSNNGWKRWDGYEIADHDQEEREYENKHEDEERCELFDDYELPVCTIIRFEIIKYSFGQDEEYVAIKEDEYEDLTNTSKEAIHAYREIFRIMDEGWKVTRTE